MQEEPASNPFSEFEHKRNISRRKLLPWWVKVFIWIFMVFGLTVPVSLVFGILGYYFGLSIYGMKTNVPLSVLGFVIQGLILLKAVTGFGLWFEKDWAIKFGLVDAILGIAICMFVMLAPLIWDSVRPSMRLEFLFLIPYLKKLLDIKKDWELT